MEIKRYYEDTLLSHLKPGKVFVLLGARRVGKTMLIQKILPKLEGNYLLLNGDAIETHNLLETQSVQDYKRILGGTQFLIIDEAQEIALIGKKLKLIVDTIPDIKVLITGSSAFELNNQIGEPLVGRMKTRFLYPIAQMEYAFHENAAESKFMLDDRLIFGSYPEISGLDTGKSKMDYLREIVNTQLLRDIFSFEGIKKRDKIIFLLQKLAFRTGSEISVEGLAREIGISKNTVDKYLDLFSKVFIIYSMSGFNRNRDNEITKMKKWYFFDNGIRNAVINSFANLNMRNDIGQLWENYLNAERKKFLEYKEEFVFEYFWRTHKKQEIDRVEEKNGQLNAYEYKWVQKINRIPSEFKRAYPDASYDVIHQGNYTDFIC